MAGIALRAGVFCRWARDSSPTPASSRGPQSFESAVKRANNRIDEIAALCNSLIER